MKNMRNIEKMKKFLLSKYGYRKYKKRIVSKKLKIEIYFDHGLSVYAIRKIGDEGWQIIEGPLERILEKLNWPDDLEMVKIRKAK